MLNRTFDCYFFILFLTVYIFVNIRMLRVYVYVCLFMLFSLSSFHTMVNKDSHNPNEWMSDIPKTSSRVDKAR